MVHFSGQEITTTSTCRPRRPQRCQASAGRTSLTPGSSVAMACCASTDGPIRQVKPLGKPWENDGLMGFYGIYPLVMTDIAVENGDL